jgi:hypothetical protein
MSDSGAAPAISVVLATDRFETVRETVEHLRLQTVAASIELVFVAPSAPSLDLDAEACAGFHSSSIVEAGSFDLLQPARAAGVRAASAPIVFFAESHCFPEPGSLQALLERHREPWVAVGQVLCNGNPATSVSWSNLVMDYGEQMAGLPGGEVARLPSHNSSFKRDALLALGDGLEHAMEIGDTLIAAVVARGGRLYLEERARTHHLNVSRRGVWLRERLAAGRGYAGRRAEDWSVARRALYGALWPLIALVRLARIRRLILRAGAGDRLLPWIYPALAAGLLVASLGEALGYLMGGGDGLRVIASMELHRRPLLRAGEPSYPDL